MIDAAASKQYVLPGHVVIPEPKLRFGGVSKDAVDIHPLRGLLNHGPFSRDKLAAVSDPIRLAVIAPQGNLRRASNLVYELETDHRPRERRQYLPAFPGFTKLFGVRLALGNGARSIELPSNLTTEILQSQRPHAVLADALTRALFALRNVRHEFDIVLIVLTRKWEPAFKETATEDFDLHDYIKAVAASEGICIQLLRDSETGALNYYCRCSVMWRLGVALYTKAGGVPWVIADAEPGTAFIGIDYALRAGTGQDARFAICCSQIF
jgi:hypothetical protein